MTKRILTVFLFLLLCGSAVSANADYTAGKEIAIEDISEFYYTIDASIYPPMYVRYQFSLKDGKKWFFHESRQGREWPQTEEDIVASGTVEVTEEEWAEFFNCLRGGTVQARSDELTDGDEGPWMYLYWTGDEGIFQEFRFASLAERIAFEELCSRLAQNHILTRFYFSRGGYMRPQSYEILLRGGCYYLQEDEDELRLFDPELAMELQQVITNYHLESWNGFYKNNPDILDGEGFGLAMAFADGTTVNASGENAFPDHYDEATEALEEIFQKEKRSRLAGTYRYEGEGFGGDFDITLNADGSYTFCEGPLSSYEGGGSWNVYYNAVYMTEENGAELQFTFGVEENALIYLEMGSDAFPCVKVEDEGRFVRLEDD